VSKGEPPKADPTRGKADLSSGASGGGCSNLVRQLKVGSGSRLSDRTVRKGYLQVEKVW